MSDISKCEGNNCSIKETCYRFTAKSNPYRQSYITPDPVNCEHYWLDTYSLNNEKTLEFNSLNDFFTFR